MRLLQLQQGVAFNIAKDEVVIDLVKAALPHQTEFIDKHRLGGLPFLVEELEWVPSLRRDRYARASKHAVYNPMHVLRVQRIC